MRVTAPKAKRQRPSSPRTGWDANHRPPGRDVLHDDRPGSDPNTIADLQALPYNGTGPHEYTVPGDHFSANRSSWHDARESSELTVMSNGREIGDERVGAETRHRRDVSIA